MRVRCEDCHAAESAQFSLPFRHPLGVSMGCTACHPAHGLAPRKLREHLRTEACVECHREHAGPFQFEHKGDRNSHLHDQGSIYRECLACHTEVHGSNWDREFLR